MIDVQRVDYIRVPVTDMGVPDVAEAKELDAELARSVEGIVATASIDALR